MLSFALLASGCTNNLLTYGSGNSNYINSPVDNGNGVDSSLVISRVSKSAVEPSTAFDVIGDGSGAMANYCSSTEEGSTAASTCQCEYSFILPDGSTNQFTVDTTYHDANLLRCPFAGEQSIPPSVSSVDVRVFLTNSQTYTNRIQVKMSGTGLALDLSDPSSFAAAERYQCRDVVSVPYLFHPLELGGIVDPVLSENPKITYPLNFYTTNMGASIANFASLSGEVAKFWNCPTLPNDSTTGSGLDLTVYSIAPDETTGSKQIFPHKSGFDRSTFYLARKATGIFNVAVNALNAPSLATGTTVNGNAIPPLGYGAAPVTTATSQTCPDTDPSVTIPDGYEWVKVWLFRANLAPREYRVSAAVATVGAIGCNPGKFPSAGTNVFMDCQNLATMSDAENVNGQPAARVLMTPKMCVNLRGSATNLFDPCSPAGQPLRHGPGCTSKNASEQYPDLDGFALGTDVWKQSGNNTSFSCGGANNLDPLNMCHAGDTIRVPHTEDLVIQNIDTQGERFDYLFVVTPPSVTTLMMKNLSNSASHPYIPYRFKPGDCSSPDPENPLTPGDCDGSKRITYGLKLHDILNEGDPPATDPNRAGVFPVCTIRPKTGG